MIEKHAEWSGIESNVVAYESDPANGDAALTAALAALRSIFVSENLASHDPDNPGDADYEEARLALAGETGPSSWSRALALMRRLVVAMPRVGAKTEDVEDFVGMNKVIDEATKHILQTLDSSDEGDFYSISTDRFSVDANFDKNELCVEIPHAVLRSALKAVKAYVKARKATGRPQAADEFNKAWEALLDVERSKSSDGDVFDSELDSYSYDLATTNLLAAMDRSGFESDADFEECYLESLFEDVQNDLLEDQVKDEVYETQAFSAGESIKVDLIDRKITLIHPPRMSRVRHVRTGRQEAPHEMQSKTEKPGRNEPCSCGSGKKYKKCCLNKDA